MDVETQKNITIAVLKRAKREFIFKFLISIFIRGCLLVLPILFSKVIDGVSAKDFSFAYLMVGISLFLTFIERVGEYYNQVSFYQLYNKLYQGFSDVAVFHTYRNSIFSLSRFSLGEYTNIMNTDIDVIAAFFSNAVLRIVQIFEFIVIYVYFFSLNINIFLITLVLSLVMLAVILGSGRNIQLKNTKQKEKLDKKTGLVHELFLGMKDIKGFQVFSKMNQKVSHITDEYLGANKSYNLLFNFVQILVLLIIELFRLVLVGYGIFEVTKGHLEIGVLLVIYNYYQKIIDNFSMITTVNVEFRTLKVSLQRFHKIVEYSRELWSSSKSLPKEYEGNIHFDQVLYGYRTDPILNHATFSIPAHSFTVITGKAGSGKTGVFDLLLRFNQQHEGFITIDHVNIQDMSGDTYYQVVSLVRKQPTFFHDSIRSNLQMVEEDFSKIIDVCKILEIHEKILRLPNGYDTVIDTSTSNISSSLKQLLAIARVILTNSKIMLFDETLSILDAKTQKKILRILKRLRKDHTIVMISREKDIIRYADYVILIDRGEVLFEGTKDMVSTYEKGQKLLFHEI